MTIPVKIAIRLPGCWPCGLERKGKKSGTSQKQGQRSPPSCKVGLHGRRKKRRLKRARMQNQFPLKNITEAPQHVLCSHLIGHCLCKECWEIHIFLARHMAASKVFLLTRIKGKIVSSQLAASAELILGRGPSLWVGQRWLQGPTSINITQIQMVSGPGVLGHGFQSMIQPRMQNKGDSW